MRFRNKETGNIVTANCYAEEFAFSHNSDYEKVLEENKSKTNKNNVTEDNKKSTVAKSKKTSDSTKYKEKSADEDLEKEKPKTGEEVIEELLQK